MGEIKGSLGMEKNCDGVVKYPDGEQDNSIIHKTK